MDMYIGRFQPYYSFATISSNCMEIGKGRYEWNGDRGRGTGNSCTAARRDFCNRYGPVKCKGFNMCYGEKCPTAGTVTPLGGPNLYGTLNSDGKNPAGILEPVVRSAQKSTGARSTSGGNTIRTPSIGGTSESENCGGCDPNDIGCELGKLSCEFTGGLRNWWDGMGSSFGKGFSEFGMLPMMALGLGGLIVIAIIMKR